MQLAPWYEDYEIDEVKNFIYAEGDVIKYLVKSEVWRVIFWSHDRSRGLACI